MPPRSRLVTTLSLVSLLQRLAEREFSQDVSDTPPSPTEEEEAAAAADMFGPMNAGPSQSEVPKAVKQELKPAAGMYGDLPSNQNKEAIAVAPAEGAEADGKNMGKKKKQKRLAWVTEPQKSLFLDVMKEGKIVERIALGGKSRLIFGRKKEADVVLHHPSASRKHAALVHGVPPGTKLPSDSAKGATLIDLKAANRTYFSPKYPCRPGAGRVKMEQGSSIVLEEANCFRFGESSRSYIVRDLYGKKSPYNPNFQKDSNDNRLSKDFGIVSKVERDESGGSIGGPRDLANPFQETATYSAPFLATVNKDLKGKRPIGEPTFSFHKRRKTEMASIRNEHEKKYRNEILALKLKEKGEMA